MGRPSVKKIDREDMVMTGNQIGEDNNVKIRSKALLHTGKYAVLGPGLLIYSPLSNFNVLC